MTEFEFVIGQPEILRPEEDRYPVLLRDIDQIVGHVARSGLGLAGLAEPGSRADNVLEIREGLRQAVKKPDPVNVTAGQVSCHLADCLHVGLLAPRHEYVVEPHIQRRPRRRTNVALVFRPVQDDRNVFPVDTEHKLCTSKIWG